MFINEIDFHRLFDAMLKVVLSLLVESYTVTWRFFRRRMKGVGAYQAKRHSREVDCRIIRGRPNVKRRFPFRTTNHMTLNVAESMKIDHKGHNHGNVI